MSSYTDADRERRVPEEPKAEATATERSAFARDRARILHSGALRRLADKTQVVGPRDGDNPRTRLTHSLEVSQIAGDIARGLGADPNLAELAGLAHDIGHPPYGHNGERALNEVAAGCGGFEGNAQTLRILTRLEPKLLDASGRSVGLNLTRASLDATCKYPWTPEDNPRKYGCYREDADVLAWMRPAPDFRRRCVEAEIMDFSDDIAYSVHDVEDGIVSGRIDLRVLSDTGAGGAVEWLAALGEEAFGCPTDYLVAAAESLWRLPIMQAVAAAYRPAVPGGASCFGGTLDDFVALKAMTSGLVGRFVSAVITDTRAYYPQRQLSRYSGEVIHEMPVFSEVVLLKTVAVAFVMRSEEHLAYQGEQRERIAAVAEHLDRTGAVDPLFRPALLAAESDGDDAARLRVFVDQIASYTESRLERIERESRQ